MFPAPQFGNHWPKIKNHTASMQRAKCPAICSFNYTLFLRARSVLGTGTLSLGLLNLNGQSQPTAQLLHVFLLSVWIQPSPWLTLLLQSGHDLDVREVLQFVAQHDGVVLHLRSTEVPVHGRLGTEDRAPEAAAFKQTEKQREKLRVWRFTSPLLLPDLILPLMLVSNTTNVRRARQ